MTPDDAQAIAEKAAQAAGSREYLRRKVEAKVNATLAALESECHGDAHAPRIFVRLGEVFGWRAMLRDLDADIQKGTHLATTLNTATRP